MDMISFHKQLLNADSFLNFLRLNGLPAEISDRRKFTFGVLAPLGGGDRCAACLRRGAGREAAGAQQRGRRFLNEIVICFRSQSGRGSTNH